MLTIVKLNAFLGPNIFGPAPGVRLRLRAGADHSRRLRAALKDGAQFVGLMLAGLHVAAVHGSAGPLLLEARFATDAPELAADLCRYVVDGLNAEAAGDEEWDRDTPLLELQERRRDATLPVAALQLVAEARRRGLPVLRLLDGRLLFGYGDGGWAADPAEIGRGLAPPWERIGYRPIVAVTGGPGRAAAVGRWAAVLAAAGLAVRTLDGASYPGAAGLLADPGAQAFVLGLDADSMLRHGLPFERCDEAVIADAGGERPAEAADDDEWLRALGLPMLLSGRPAHLNLADPRLSPLVPYAPYGVAGEEGPTRSAAP